MIFQGHNIKIVYGVQLITLHISFKKLRQLLYMLTEGTLKALRHIKSCRAGVALHFAKVIGVNTGKVGQRSAVFTCQKAIFVCQPADSLFLEMLFGKSLQIMSGKDFNAFVAAAFRRHRTEQESLGTTEGNCYLVKPAFADFIQLLKNNVNVFADFFVMCNNFFTFTVFSL